MKHSEQETKENFSYFLEELSHRMEESYPERLETEQTKVLKNNSVLLHGFLIREKGSRIAPTFYLGDEFEQYRRGRKTIEEIAEYVLQCYEEEKEKKQEVLNRLDFTWESMRHAVTYRLVNREKNAEMLKTAPYEEFLDLALIYQYTIKISEDMQGTVQILKEHMEHLHISNEELRAVAAENTRRIHPPVIYAMEDVLFGTKKAWRGEKIDTQAEHGLYVLTNEAGIHGAASLIFKERLREFALAAGGGFYILPSSIHEVIFVPDVPGISLKFLAASVKSINATRVAATEVLSDQVYYFDPESDCIRRLGAAEA